MAVVGPMTQEDYDRVFDLTQEVRKAMCEILDRRQPDPGELMTAHVMSLCYAAAAGELDRDQLLNLVGGFYDSAIRSAVDAARAMATAPGGDA